jgi:hypothetical protein
MRADATIRPPRQPRGLILSTGEDVPKGQSLRARLFVLEVSKGEIGPVSVLSACQKDAREGLYALSMACFIRWLAPRYGEIKSRLRAEASELRETLHAEDQHARTPGIVADLALGWRYFLAFARDVGAITPSEHADLWERGWQGLVEAGVLQGAPIEAAEPAGYFLRLLSAAIASGRAYLADKSGDAPENADQWGWRKRSFGTGEKGREDWEPRGRLIGWVVENDIYLEPDASYAEASDLARQQNDSLPVSSRTLWQRLREKNFLASWDAKRKRNTTRRRIGKSDPREVIHLRPGLLPCAGPSTPSTDPKNTGERVDIAVDSQPMIPRDRPRRPSTKSL